MAKKQAPAAEGAAAEGKGKGKLKLIIIIVVALLLVIGASVGATWFLLGKKSANPSMRHLPLRRHPCTWRRSISRWCRLSW